VNVDYAICTFGTNSQDPLQETDLDITCKTERLFVMEVVGLLYSALV